MPYEDVIDYLPYELPSGMVEAGKLGILESGISPYELAKLDNKTMEEDHVPITELLFFFKGAIPLEQITKMIDDLRRPRRPADRRR